MRANATIRLGLYRTACSVCICAMAYVSHAQEPPVGSASEPSVVARQVADNVHARNNLVEQVKKWLYFDGSRSVPRRVGMAISLTADMQVREVSHELGPHIMWQSGVGMVRKSIQLSPIEAYPVAVALVDIGGIESLEAALAAGAYSDSDLQRQVGIFTAYLILSDEKTLIAHADRLQRGVASEYSRLKGRNEQADRTYRKRLMQWDEMKAAIEATNFVERRLPPR